MTMIQTQFKAALVALTLCVGAMAANPAQAQQRSPSDFSLDFRGGAAERSLSGHCMSNSEVRRAIAANGYRGVEIRGDLPRDRVEVAGQNGNWLYSMRVDKCSGEVDRVQRIRRMQGGGFGLQFNFGN